MWRTNSFLVLTVLLVTTANCCDKTPQRQLITKPKTAGDNGYRLVFSESVIGYEPGKRYNLFLLGAQSLSNVQQFTHFTVTAKSATSANRKAATYSLAGPKRVGRFQLFTDEYTVFNEDCVNTVSQSNNQRKTEIQVMWVAPAKGSGCVAISAMVYEQDEDKWYADDGKLTNIICEKQSDPQEHNGECCACEAAKYSFVFEGIWSNETHPRDYPFAVWLTHFSDVIGASHDGNFSFWGENHISTDGFRSMAEWGSVRLLETELRARGPRLRTLIKAAGLWYPDVNSNTTAVFRTDRKYHKVSLVSMFGPSPDWVVGINGLNLCQTDCTWKESLDIDLYPWDAGTDSGISYMSPNSETIPREKMYRITTMYPEDPRQPFYNPRSSVMTPLAKLYIRRERTIPRNCDENFLQSQILDESENTEVDNRRECRTTDYTAWSSCSVTCGKGLRMRSRQYRRPQLAKTVNCNRQLISKEMCVADIPECKDADSEEDEDENLAQSSANVNEVGEGVGVCATTPWAEWSPCSATCGIGISMRTRTFVDYHGRRKCPHITIVEKEKCMKPECSVDDMEIPDPECPVNLWSDWSPCSATCGNGVSIRTRLLLTDDTMKETCSNRMELHQQRSCSVKSDCSFDRENAIRICALPSIVGPCRGQFNRYFFDSNTQTCQSFTYGGCRGNQNNFFTIDDCERNCLRSSRGRPNARFLRI